MAAQRDYYEILGVPRDADARAIKDAFRALALQYHPDRNKEPGAEDRFKDIAAAYAVLSDPEKRKAYDTRGIAGVGMSSDELFRTVDLSDLFGGLGFDVGGRGGLFERFFGARQAGPRRGRDVEVELAIPLARVVTGGDETVRYARTSRCQACRGTGAKEGTKRHACAACGGSGTRTQDSRRHETTGDVLIRNISACPDCRGQGDIIDETCPVCHGRGMVDEQRTLTVKVPIGAEDGMMLRIPGHGLPSDAAGGPPGDLLVLVHAAPDPRFERHGADLLRREQITVVDAVLGTEHSIPSPGGDVDVTIPPGIQPGVLLRLAGKGLPELGGARRGDLYVQLEVQIPETLTARQRDLYEQLRAHERNGARKRPARRRKPVASSPMTASPTTAPAPSATADAKPTT